MRAEATSADRELNMQAPDEVIESPMVTERDFIPEVAATPEPAAAATPEPAVEPTPLQQKTQSKPGAFGIVRRSTLFAEYDRGVR